MTATKPAKLPPTPDPRCGTPAGYLAHYRRGESACLDCTEIERARGREKSRRRRSTPEGLAASRKTVREAARRRRATSEGRESYREANRKMGTDYFREAQRAVRTRRRARTPEECDADFVAKWPDGKACQSCGEILPAEAFYRNRQEVDGRTQRCIPCHLAHKAAKRWAKLTPTWLARNLSPSVCGYCLQPIGPGSRDVDHFNPVARGGSDDPSNLIPACPACNRGPGGKFDRDPFEWLAETHPERLAFFESIFPKESA